MKINFNNATFSQYMHGNSFWRIECIWWFGLPFLWPMLPSLHRKSFDNEKGKKIMKLSYDDITLLKATPRGYSLIKAIQVWAGPKGMVVDPFMSEIGRITTIWEKQIKRETGLGFALPCTRSVFILFSFIVGFLFIYLFFYLSIYLFFFSFAFYEQRFR